MASAEGPAAPRRTSSPFKLLAKGVEELPTVDSLPAYSGLSSGGDDVPTVDSLPGYAPTFDTLPDDATSRGVNAVLTAGSLPQHDFSTILSDSDSDSDSGEVYCLFDGISPEDVPCQMLVFAASSACAPPRFEELWHSTIDSLQRRLQEDYAASIDVVIVVADVRQEAHLERCKAAIHVIDDLGPAAPPAVLLSHTSGVLDNDAWDLSQARWLELLHLGLDDVAAECASGLDLKLWIHRFLATQHMRLQRLAAEVSERQRLALEKLCCKRHNDNLLWQYAAPRLAPALPRLNGTLPLGIPQMLDGFQIGRKLGSGAFGTVYLAMRGTEPVVAFKALDKAQFTDVVDIKQLDANLELMRHLSSSWRHNNIVQFHCAYHSATHVFQRFEFAGSNNLCRRLIAREKDGLPKQAIQSSKAIAIVGQVASALGHLHDGPQVCHRDVKPENIIVFRETEDSIEIKLADFDSARQQLPGKLSVSCVGTFPFQAPEVLSGYAYDGKAADVWSLGVVHLEVQCRVQVLERAFCDGQPLRGRVAAGAVHAGLTAPAAVNTVLSAHTRAELRPCAETARHLASGMLTADVGLRWGATAVSDFVVASSLRRRLDVGMW